MKFEDSVIAIPLAIVAIVLGGTTLKPSRPSSRREGTISFSSASAR